MSSAVIQRLRKRRAYPLEICGEIIHIRAVTRSEREQMKPHMAEEVSYGITLGFGLVTVDGSPVFRINDGESVEDFGERVLTEADLPDDTRTEICAAIVKLSQGPTKEQLEALKKS